MFTRLCYYYDYTMDQVLDMPFPHIFTLLDELQELIDGDTRGSM